MLLMGSGVATAADPASGFEPNPDPNAAPSARPAAGPEAEMGLMAGARPVSGKLPAAAPLRKQDRFGVQLVNSQKVVLKNSVTDADGDKANLTFEVWTADGTTPKTKVKISDNEYGVIVSPYVASGTTVSVSVPLGKLQTGVDYMFHTSAYDGSLYETSWSPWQRFRIELPVDLTLPAPNYSAPDPSWFAVGPSSTQTKPLGAPATSAARSAKNEQCGPVDDEGRQVCFGLSENEPLPADAAARVNAAWCEPSAPGISATRFAECDVRIVPVELKMDGETQAKTFFTFLRLLELNGTDSFTERLTVLPAQTIPAAFARIDLKLAEHLCQGSCKAVEPEHGAWTATPSWKPGDTHSASLTTRFTWDASATGNEYLFKPDVKIDADIYGADGASRPIMTGYQWSKGYALPDRADLDQIRCDTKTSGAASGCVFRNSAPTYIFNAKKYPQAAAHAWLIQTHGRNNPGAALGGTPLYYMGNSAQNTKNRGRICPTGWAATNGHASALVDAADALNCDEFAFASTYNSGGMATNEGGLNPAIPTGSTTGVPNGSACIQTYVKKQGTPLHMFSVDGTNPTFNEVCGRSAISGIHNQESMGNRFVTFMREMRIMDKDAYWVDTRMTAINACLYGAASGLGDPVICKLTAN
ncbi:hypothetical protein [Streptomyces gardneri]|uniref:hypothetical protein n=1 Tax=Streptomyces gardneri TaxID=66892 RepID=UPI0035D5E10E